MEFRYPLVLLVGISVVLIMLFVSFLIKPHKKNEYVEGKKIANTKIIKDTPFYKKLIKKYKIWLIIGRLGTVITLIGAILLVSEPFQYKVTTQVIYNRDIFICMDVSTSVDELNMELVDQFQDNPLGLTGEQVGVSIFNTSSVLLVPLTSDYDYVNSQIDMVGKGLNTRNSYDNDLSDYYYSYYIEAGTLVGNETRGSSLIGDGLASCIFDFPDNPDGERTQIIILTTDNEAAGDELVTLTEACELAKKKGIVVYGIAPIEADDYGYNEEIRDMKAGVESTGGKFYAATNKKAVEQVFADIKKRESSQFEKTDTFLQLLPFKPYILLLVGVGIMTLSRKKVLG